MDIYSLIGLLIIAGLFFWVIRTLGSAWSIPAPILLTLQVILVVIVVVSLLNLLGMHGPPLRIGR